LPESDKQDDFIWKKKIIFNWKNKIELEAINIYKWDYSKLPEKFVLVWKDTTPKHLNEIIKSECILLERSTDISHWAIMSRELKKDCIYWISGIADNISSWDILEIDFDTLEITKT
jgi:phosphoenolpyruvate-protein kinase (PTS system EI component)